MQIRIYETDFEGHPVKCTGDYFAGPSALAIVEAMKMDPFNASRDPLEFMRSLLDSIGEKDFPLTGDPGKAAVAFLQRLTILEYAEYVLAPGDVFSEGCKNDNSADSEIASKMLKIIE